jgi:hypothetical protein
MELHSETQVMGEELDLMVQFWSQGLWCMDMEGSCTSQKSEGGDHTNETETVVTMQVGNEDVAQFGETHPTPAELHLCAFSTVEHEHFLTHLNHLRRGVMTKGGKRTSTP